MAFLVLGANSVSGYTVKNSLRFNSASSDYLNRTPATTTNRRTWTWSGWVKRSTISGTQVLFGHNNYPTLQTSIRFTNDNTFSLAGTGFSGTDESVTSNQVFRDVSAWYHLVVAVDTTQATSSNRVKLYSNGVEITSLQYNAYPTLNLDTAINYSSAINYIGATNTPTANANLYMAEVNLIDGQQLTPSSFGETDTDTGIWKPKAYTGTYGTNGFYLQFKNSASLGTDSSGNGNTFTVNNLTSVDQSTDTPTNNFCTWNPLDIANPSYVNTLTEGNLKAGNSTGDSLGYYFTTFANFSPSKGKWYWEIKVDLSPTTLFAGIYFGQNTFTTAYPYDAYTFSIPQNGMVYYNGASYTYGASFTTNDILTLALDMDSGKLYVGKNGSWANGSGSTNQTFANAVSVTTVSASFPTGRDVFPIVVAKNAFALANFGSPFYSANGYTDGAGYGNFSYAVPSGYYSLNTKNLATYG